jgi:hypothetical protein
MRTSILVYLIGQHTKKRIFRQGLWSYMKLVQNKDLEISQKRFVSTQDVLIVTNHSKVTKKNKKNILS